MKILRVSVFLLIAAGFICSSAYAAGDAKRGKDLFNNPKLGGATSGKSCNSCHPGGKGLEDAGDRKGWKMMGKKFNSIEAVINWDIEKALHGSALDPKGADMADLVAYIKSLKKD